MPPGIRQRTVAEDALVQLDGQPLTYETCIADMQRVRANAPLYAPMHLVARSILFLIREVATLKLSEERRESAGR